MPEVKRSALVSHSPAQMFDLVRDVERYPEFLSWVVDAQVHEETEHHQLASMEVSVAGIRRRITTRNQLEPEKSLSLQLEKGPFRHFSGLWCFTDLGVGCRIELSLGFDFDNPILVATFSRGFVKIANRMVEDFSGRADELYG